jgi:CO/xanthine dehydrogenase Mo-binding subunit
MTPLVDAELAIPPTTPPIHPDGNLIRHQRIIHGDSNATAEIIVEGNYTIGMQDQAFLGLEAAMAFPDPGAQGVELHIATQWLHEDRGQIAACLNLPENNVRLVLGGVRGGSKMGKDGGARRIGHQPGRRQEKLGEVHAGPLPSALNSGKR